MSVIQDEPALVAYRPFKSVGVEDHSGRFGRTFLNCGVN